MPTKPKVRVHLVENAEILITAEIQESKLPDVVSGYVSNCRFFKPKNMREANILSAFSGEYYCCFSLL